MNRDGGFAANHALRVMRPPLGFRRLLSLQNGLGAGTVKCPRLGFQLARVQCGAHWGQAAKSVQIHRCKLMFPVTQTSELTPH